MFRFLSKIFGGKNPVDTVVNAIDKFTLTKEEKLQFKKEMEQFFHDAEMQMQKEVTERWRYDTQSDSWLSKNIRPLVLAYLVFCTTLLVFIDAGVITFDVKEHWVSLLTTILVTVIAAYFGGRSWEKRKK